MNAPYQPPTDILDVLRDIEFEDALTAEDARYVDTREARGSQKTLRMLSRMFGLQLPDGPFRWPLTKHVLFFGHIGSGKTTELRRYAAELSHPDRPWHFAVEINVKLLLDGNNLNYADLLMGMALRLLACLQEKHIDIDGIHLQRLEHWFGERVMNFEEVKTFEAEVRAGAEIKSGIPGLLSLFGKLTSAFKTNSTHKEALRLAIRNTFTDFATAFNALLRAAEAQIAARGLGQRVLFLVDGTDRLNRDDARAMFQQDVAQLLNIEAHVVYTAPLGLKFEGGLDGKLDDLVLPMLKLQESDGSDCPAGRAALRELLLRRADISLFAGEAEIARLVEVCGGHPRDLLRLLMFCCQLVDYGEPIDAATVDAAIKRLAADYRYKLEPDDYKLLAQLDADHIHAGNDERLRKLLYECSLLEYNNGSWRRSHPVVRTLEGYQRAASSTIR